MAIKKDNYQVTAVLTKELLELLDKEAAENERTRSKQISFIIKEYYKEYYKNK